MTEPSDAKPQRVYHVTFMVPVRVLLQGKSTPLVAVTAVVTPSETPDVFLLKCKEIFPINAGALWSTELLQVHRHNLAGALELPPQ